MSVAQWVAVLVMVGLNALDGFDILSISFASPGIATNWGINKATLGWVLSMELIGMGVGSILLGGVADKIGRRPTILGCLVAMTIGMLGAGHASDVQTLSIWRLLTGLGIGGMLAAISAATAECSNLRWRSVAMALMVIGYPLGGVIGGLAVQNLLVTGTWHDIFIWGAWCTAAFIPIVWFLLPESVSFLVRQKKSGTLERINRILTRFQHAQVDVLADDSTQVVKTSVTDILKPALLLTTVLITFAYFAHVVSFYFIIKWVPKIVVDMGFAPAAAAGVLMWANVGGATGGGNFWPDCNAGWSEAIDRRNAAGLIRFGHLVRPWSNRSHHARYHGCDCGFIYQRVDRGALFVVRESIPDTSACNRHRFCDWRGSRRRRSGAGARRLSVPGRAGFANGCHYHGHRLTVGSGSFAGAQGEGRMMPNWRCLIC